MRTSTTRTLQDIDKAIDLYGDTIVWEVPARGVLHRDKAAVKAAYLKMFESYQIHSMTPVRRFAADNYVVDDTVADMTLVGDVDDNVPGCPLPAGPGSAFALCTSSSSTTTAGSSARTATSCGGGPTAPSTTTSRADAPTVSFD